MFVSVQKERLRRGIGCRRACLYVSFLVIVFSLCVKFEVVNYVVMVDWGDLQDLFGIYNIFGCFNKLL